MFRSPFILLILIFTFGSLYAQQKIVDSKTEHKIKNERLIKVNTDSLIEIRSDKIAEDSGYVNKLGSLKSQAMEDKKMKIGLALGSGSARGWSHIGVIRELEEAGIKIDYVAGTSIGAFVGAFYSTGNMDILEKFALQMDWKAIISFFDVGFPRRGLLDGEKIYQLVSKEILTENIEETNIPFHTVATNLATGKEFIFKNGSIVDAVRASISIPGIFTPFKKDNYNLVDGGVVNPVPVDVVRNMGADIVIAVDLNSDLIEHQSMMKNPQPAVKDSLGEKIDTLISSSNIKVINTLKGKYQNIEKSVSMKLKEWTPDTNDMNIFEVIGTSINIMEHRITQNNLKIHKPDILIQPSLGHLGLFDYDQAAETIEEGRVATKKKIPEILNIINSKKD